MTIQTNPSRLDVRHAAVSAAGASFLALAFVTTSAGAQSPQRWVELTRASDDSATIYVDPTSVRRDGDTLLVWREVLFSAVQTIGDGKQYRRSVSQLRIRCAAGEWDLRYALYYQDTSGASSAMPVYTFRSPNDGRAMDPAAPGTVDERLVNYYCARAGKA